MSIITLLTDFGTADPYVGELRGVLLSRAPGVVLADLTHDVSPGNIPAAAYILGRAWSQYPAGTVHMVVVDPGVGTRRRALAFSLASHFFVGPDNGVFTGLPDLEQADIVELPVVETRSTDRRLSHAFPDGGRTPR
jgi:S-adenosylmethionine hydrolase